MEKQPFDIGVALDRIEQAVQPWPKAALFQLAEEGYTSTFEQLLACIISIRTYDEVTLPVARTLFARARLPAEVARRSWDELDALPGAGHVPAGRRRRTPLTGPPPEVGLFWGGPCRDNGGLLSKRCTCLRSNRSPSPYPACSS